MILFCDLDIVKCMLLFDIIFNKNLLSKYIYHQIIETKGILENKFWYIPYWNVLIDFCIMKKHSNSCNI